MTRSRIQNPEMPAELSGNKLLGSSWICSILGVLSSSLGMIEYGHTSPTVDSSLFLLLSSSSLPLQQHGPQKSSVSAGHNQHFCDAGSPHPLVVSPSVEASRTSSPNRELALASIYRLLVSPDIGNRVYSKLTHQLLLL